MRLVWQGTGSISAVLWALWAARGRAHPVFKAAPWAIMPVPAGFFPPRGRGVTAALIIAFITAGCSQASGAWGITALLSVFQAQW